MMQILLILGRSMCVDTISDSQAIINEYLGISRLIVDYIPSMKTISQEITENIHYDWPAKDLLNESNLNVKYVILYKIGVANYHISILILNHRIDTYIITFASLHIIACIPYRIMLKMSGKIYFQVYRKTDRVNFQMCVKLAGENFQNQARIHLFY